MLADQDRERTEMTDQPTSVPTFGLWYDFRNPSGDNPVPDRPFSTFYRQVLDQIAWAEEIGLDVCPALQRMHHAVLTCDPMLDREREGSGSLLAIDMISA